MRSFEGEFAWGSKAKFRSARRRRNASPWDRFRNFTETVRCASGSRKISQPVASDTLASTVLKLVESKSASMRFPVLGQFSESAAGQDGTNQETNRNVGTSQRVILFDVRSKFMMPVIVSLNPAKIKTLRWICNSKSRF